MEQNGAYQEAIKTLQAIREAAPEDTEIVSEIEHLREKLRQSQFVQKVLQGLSLRIAEIARIYKPLVLRLKRMVREGIDEEGEILLDVLEQFLDKELVAEALLTFWESFDTKTSQAAQHPRYNILAERLQRGELISFLGPGIHHLSKEPLVTSKELTQKLANQAEYQNFSGTLSMISQYYQMTEYGRGTLLRTVQETVEPRSALQQANPLHELLVRIHCPILMISASYDNQLERSFLEAQKKFVVISHLREEGGVGKIVLKYAEKSHPESPITTEDVSKLNLLENGYSIIYKVCGCFGLHQEGIIGKTVADPRTIQQKNEVQEKWDLLSEKLSRLERGLILETNPEEKFRLEKSIADIKAEREQVEQQLNEVEARLLPQGGAQLYQTSDAQGHIIDSVFISEDDYFAFAKRVETLIPGYLAKQVSQKSLLFLGHNLNEWQDRLILTTILEKRRTNRERSYAVQENPTAYETAYWKFHGVDLYQVSLKTFVEKLGENIK